MLRTRPLRGTPSELREAAVDGQFTARHIVAAIEGAGSDAEPSETARAVLGVILDVEDNTGIAAYRRRYATSIALRSGLARMWPDWEDRIAAALGAVQGESNVGTRFLAMQLVGMVRASRPRSSHLRLPTDAIGAVALVPSTRDIRLGRIRRGR